MLRVHTNDLFTYGHFIIHLIGRFTFQPFDFIWILPLNQNGTPISRGIPPISIILQLGTLQLNIF